MFSFQVCAEPGLVVIHRPNNTRAPQGNEEFRLAGNREVEGSMNVDDIVEEVMKAVFVALSENL